MAIFKNSRYRRVGTYQAPTPDGDYRLFFEIRETTKDVPSSYRTYTTRSGDTLASIARDQLGTPELWWVLADLNPTEAFYPLDLPSNTELVVPSAAYAGLQR
jgi:hypothetical protein